MKKWLFSSTFQVPKNPEQFKEFKNLWPPCGLKSVPKTRKKMNTVELKRNKTSQWLQTRKVWMNFNHLSCRITVEKALEMMNWFCFSGKNEPWSFYHRDMLSHTCEYIFAYTEYIHEILNIFRPSVSAMGYFVYH